MATPPLILERVETFRRNLESYLSPDYKEAQLRREFLDPLFEVLGWDVQNKQGYAEAYKDIVHEDTLRISDLGTKAPDYSFRIGGTRKFFVEAKKPAVSIKDDPEPAQQLRRYSWSAKLPLGILTDFQEFAIYDTRIKPLKNDPPQKGRIFYCKFEEYPQKWDEIAAIFSRDAVLKGSFDRYAVSVRGKRGTASVDEDFLDTLNGWRLRLAKNLALRNGKLSQRDLNFAVQRILDRIIFLRIAEDRGIENYGQLLALTGSVQVEEAPDEETEETPPPADNLTVSEPTPVYHPRRMTIYPRLCEIFERADFRYNSGLFHFHHEKGRDAEPDLLTLGLHIDDVVLRDIIAGLYYPESPYVFSVIAAEILGHVYEQFLGKVIRLTEGHHAVVEDKPEVRKAHGVYYTPIYIVDYIVRQTVGPLVESRTPKQVEKLRILDPACGSGSFLLGAFQFLLDWHLRYYVENDLQKWARQKHPPIYETAPNALGVGRGSGNWQLTISERKRILINNLYGVDIDAQAVEVTKLSLLLKVLEGEARELRGKQMEFHRVLPDLGKNIKCGNSLIGSDFYRQLALPDLDDEARYKINVFDWEQEFACIMKAGGFDAVIGNPPYVLLQDEFRDDPQLAYFRNHFEVSSYKIDTYHLFYERGIRLTRRGGRLGFITPSNYLTNNFLVALRRFLLRTTQPTEIVVVEGGVFAGASVDTAITSVERTDRIAKAFPIRRASFTAGTLEFREHSEVVPHEVLKDKNTLLTGSASKKSHALWAKCERRSMQLGNLAHVNFGKQLRDRKKFGADVIEVASLRAVPDTHKPCYTGRDVARYALSWGNRACLDDEIARSGGCWDAERHHAKNKLLTRQIGRIPAFALDRHGFDCLNTVFMVNAHSDAASSPYLLGLLNSRLLAFLWLERFYDKRGTFPKIKGSYLKLLPIRRLDLTNNADRARHDELVALVERMLKLHEGLTTAKTPDAQERLQREIAQTDHAIDQLVYRLYDLTPDEIALVEQATA